MPAAAPVLADAVRTLREPPPATAGELARRIRSAAGPAPDRGAASGPGGGAVAVARAMARLRQLASSAALIEHAAAEACRSCGFTRVMLSRVRDGVWAPQGLHLTRDAPRNTAFSDYVDGLEIPLSHMLVETNLVRRRVPLLVAHPAQNRGTAKDLVRVSGSTAYVAAPIMPTGRVIGFLHADRAGSPRDVDDADLQNLWTFAESFGLLFEDLVLLERLEVQRARIVDALIGTATAVDRMCAEQVELARHERIGPAGATHGPRAMADRRAVLDRVLTARERDVVELMAAGATNREIGERLGIGTGTVKTHSTRILRKLRVSSRAEVAARVVQLSTASDPVPPPGGRATHPRNDLVIA